MYIYKVKKESNTGQKLVALLRQIDECDEAADRLAISVGANAYLPHEYGDFGGMMAVSFPPTTLPSSKDWESVGEMNDGHKYYVPRVQVSEEWMQASKAAEYELNSRYRVDSKNVKYEQLMGVFSREQAASMAGLQLTTPSVDVLGKRHSIPKHEMSMLRVGVPAQHALKGFTEEVIAEFMRTQVEDMCIAEKLNGTDFRRVEHVKGYNKAVAFYKKCMDLPTIPQGTTNALCQVNDDKHRCGVSEYEDYVYITAGAESTCEEFTPVSDLEFQQVCSIRDAEAAARRMSKIDKTLN